MKNVILGWSLGCLVTGVIALLLWPPKPITPRAYQIELEDEMVILFDGDRFVGKYQTDTAHYNQLDLIINKDNE